MNRQARQGRQVEAVFSSSGELGALGDFEVNWESCD
jgi:hypothetical protein